MFTSLSIIFLFVASIWPTGQLGISAFASLFVAAAVIETGRVMALCVYIASSALALVLVPISLAPFLFALFFGYYPIIKSLIEQIPNRLFQWILKIAVMNAALAAIWILLNVLTTGLDGLEIGLPGIFLLCNLIFVPFDYGFSKMIWFYRSRISKFLKDK